MRLLDLFCCAGGASTGYYRAGFDVVGVDISPQPHYPFEFHQADALVVLRGETDIDLDEFDAIHASPPCQGYSTITGDARGRWPRLIPKVRSLLKRTGKPWVIENVAGARSVMPDAIALTGGSFGLQVRRLRLFESNIPMLAVPPVHQEQVIGVYGQHPDGREYLRPDGTGRGVKAHSLGEARYAMGIDWMDWDELTEAIPPAYTEFIGRQLVDQLQGVAA